MSVVGCVWEVEGRADARVGTGRARLPPVQISKKQYVVKISPRFDRRFRAMIDALPIY